MGYKWIGAVLIVGSCSGCGFAIAAGKRREERLLLQLMGILQFMESELQYRLTPLPDLCRMAAGEGRGVLRTVFLNLYRELSWQKLPDAGSCMHAAIQRTGEVPARVRRLWDSLVIPWADSICRDKFRAFRQYENAVRIRFPMSGRTEKNSFAAIRHWGFVPVQHWPLF